jgi:hypothetical protein
MGFFLIQDSQRFGPREVLMQSRGESSRESIPLEIMGQSPLDYLPTSVFFGDGVVFFRERRKGG